MEEKDLNPNVSDVIDEQPSEDVSTDDNVEIYEEQFSAEIAPDKSKGILKGLLYVLYLVVLGVAAYFCCYGYVYFMQMLGQAEYMAQAGEAAGSPFLYFVLMSLVNLALGAIAALEIPIARRTINRRLYINIVRGIFAALFIALPLISYPLLTSISAGTLTLSDNMRFMLSMFANASGMLLISGFLITRIFCQHKPVDSNKLWEEFIGEYGENDFIDEELLEEGEEGYEENVTEDAPSADEPPAEPDETPES